MDTLADCFDLSDYEAEEEGSHGLSSALPDLDAAKANRLILILRSSTTERLKVKYVDQIGHGNEAGALAIGSELSRRGVAPCFRDGTDGPSFRDNVVTDCILAKCDMQWVATRYPEHRTHWQSMRGIFDPSKFSKAVEYAIWEGRRTPGELSKALALNDSQQRECRIIQRLHVKRWLEALKKRQALMEARISGAVRVNDKRDTARQDETIQRRKDLWLCAEFGYWKPQRTAELYAMKTGTVLARNVVGKQLEKIRDTCRSAKKSLPN